MVRIYFILSLLIVQTGVSGSDDVIKISDTVLVGKIIALDSIRTASNITYGGFIYYYGVFHIKIELVNFIDSVKKPDTLILAYVYSKFKEDKQYKTAFDFKVNRPFIFYLHDFNPCKSDFPKIEGHCVSDSAFFPDSNTLIKKYNTIKRVIWACEFHQ